MSIIKPFWDFPGFVPPHYFVGCEDLFSAYSSKLENCSDGNLQFFLITGVNKIGKSSFLEYLAHFANDSCTFLNRGVVVDYETINDIDFIVSKLLSELLYASISYDEKFAIKMGLSDYIVETGWHYVKFTNEFINYIKSNFAHFLIRLIDNISSNGIFLKIDTSTFEGKIENFSIFLNWFNEVVGDLNTFASDLPISVSLVLPKYNVHEFLNYNSLFNEIFAVGELKRLNDDVIRNSFEKGFNKVKIIVSDELMDLLVNFSAGHPKIMNDLGNALFYGYRKNDEEFINNRVINSKEIFCDVISEKYRNYPFYLLLTGDDDLDKLYVGILNKFSYVYVNNWEYSYRFNLSKFRLTLNEDEYLIFDDFIENLVNFKIIQFEDNESFEFLDSTFLIIWNIYFLSYNNKIIKSNIKRFNERFEYNNESISTLFYNYSQRI